ncbi:MAG: CCA tRNA nucleotidyltransferase [Pseudomonadota bacterium]
MNKVKIKKELKQFQTSLYNNALKVHALLAKNGFKSFFVGGFARDLLLGLDSSDIDIATDAKASEVQKIFNNTIPVGISFGVVIVLMGKDQFQVSTFRKDIDYQDGRRPSAVEFTDEVQDVKRRDFRINGLLFDPDSHEITDCVGGVQDLDKKVLACIGDPRQRFNEDKLRLFRAVRFASTLNFKIEPETLAAIKEMVDQINLVSSERIREELEKMLTRPNPHLGLELLFDTGLLKQILPEVFVLREIEQPKQFHPEGNVFNHVYEMLRLAKVGSEFALFLAVLLHDIGKATTMELTDRIRFNNHDKESYQLSKPICERLKLSNKETDLVLSLIVNHMRFMNVKKMKLSTFRKFISLERFDLHLELHRLDCLSSHRKMDNYNFVMEKINELKNENNYVLPKKLVDGKDLLELGIAESPIMGEILKEVYDMQLEGRFKDKEEAMSYVKDKLKK